MLGKLTFADGLEVLIDRPTHLGRGAISADETDILNVLIPERFRMVSRSHALIRRSNEGYVIKNISPENRQTRIRNRLYVGGQNVEETAVLPSGAEVILSKGERSISFQFEYVRPNGRSYSAFIASSDSNANARLIHLLDTQYHFPHRDIFVAHFDEVETKLLEYADRQIRRAVDDSVTVISLGGVSEEMGMSHLSTMLTQIRGRKLLLFDTPEAFAYVNFGNILEDTGVVFPERNDSGGKYFARVVEQGLNEKRMFHLASCGYNLLLRKNSSPRAYHVVLDAPDSKSPIIADVNN